MMLSALFVNRYRELRYGWRLLAFLLVAVSLGYYSIKALQMIGQGGAIAVGAAALAAVCVATWVMMRFVNRKPFSAIGLAFHPGTGREFGLGWLLGFLMIAGIFLVEYLLGYVTLYSRSLGILGATRIVFMGLLTFMVGAAFEELLFRGYFFQTLIQWITFLPAVVLVACLFALSHLANPNASTFGIVNVGLAGAWLSVAYMKTRSLWLPLGLHASWNFFEATVFSYPVSGMELNERSLFVLTQSGPLWITGGAFGPEGGALATLALLFCTAYVLKSSSMKAPVGIITLDSVEDLLPPSHGAEEKV